MLERLVPIVGPRRSYRFLKLWWRVRRPVTIGVRVFVTRGDEVLLVRHTYREGWFLPGGGIGRGETLEEAARRECLEETGIELGELRLFGVYANFAHRVSDHVVVFSAETSASPGAHDYEIAEVRFAPLRDLPPGMFPATTRRIAEYLGESDPPFNARW